MVNPSGKFSRKRKVDPQEWYQHYQEEIEQNEAPRCKRRQVKKHKIPKNFFKTPKRWKQVSIYMKRDLLSKIANRQYMTISLLEAPLLAVILGYFTKYMSGTENDPLAYVFSKNVNIPGYLFMSVLVALFIGLIQSSDEIFKDRKIVERERFLNLSKISYLSSKVFILFSLSAFQTIVYVLIGNYILEIEGLTFFYWLILFSTACFANALGLNLSAGLSSAVAIYVLIPLLLIPQILFSGVVVQFNKLPYHVNSYKYTPVIGDIMVSRWSYEALAVNQFKRNKYNEDIFPAELVRQNYAYLLYYFLPELHRQLAELSGEENHKKDYTRISLPGEFEKLNSKIEGLNVKPFDIDKFKNASGEIYQEAGLFLDKVEQVFQKEYAEASQRRETIIMEKIREAGGRDELVKMKQNYHNENLTDQLEGTNEMDKFKIIKGEIIQLDKPVYNLPDHKFGRAQFYASYKRVANGYMDTIAFNLIVIWVFIIILLLTLYFDVLKKLLFYFERVRLRKRFFRQLRNVGITVDNIKKNI
jgi:hypothetical protein